MPHTGWLTLSDHMCARSQTACPYLPEQPSGKHIWQRDHRVLLRPAVKADPQDPARRVCRRKQSHMQPNTHQAWGQERSPQCGLEPACLLAAAPWLGPLPLQWRVFSSPLPLPGEPGQPEQTKPTVRKGDAAQQGRCWPCTSPGGFDPTTTKNPKIMFSPTQTHIIT